MFPKRLHLFYMALIAAASSSLVRADEKSLDDVLKGWEQATTQIKRLDCRFKRFEYQTALGVERRAEGSIALLDPEHAAISIDAPVAKKETVSRKKDARGVPYTIQQEEPARLIWLPGELIRIDQRAGTYRRIKAEENPALAQFPLAEILMTGDKAGELRNRFDVQLVQRSGQDIWLDLTPKQARPGKSSPVSKLRVILDESKFLPKAIQFQPSSSSGDATVFTFSQFSINQGVTRAGSLALTLENYREEK